MSDKPLLFQNGLEEIQRLARFLQVKAVDNLDICKAIQAKCSFSSYQAGKVLPKPIAGVVKNDFRLTRKGLLVLISLS